jgi:DNA-damage-inducible protein D
LIYKIIEIYSILLYYEVGKNIREVILKNGGTVPEKLPTPKKSLKELEKEELQKIGKS